MKLFINVLELKPGSVEADALYELLSSSKWFLFRQKQKTPNFQIELSHQLMRNTKSKKTRASFYVRKNEMGEGGYGAVDALYGRIVLLDERKTCLYLPHVKYVAKEADLDQNPDEETKESTEREMLSYLNLGGQLLAELVRHETFLMKRMQGKDLVDYFENKKVSTKKRMAVCRAILQAYKEQVLEKGIIHRDVKVDNIIVHRGRSGAYVVNFIDFQSAVKLTDKQNDAEIVLAKRVGCFENIDVKLQIIMLKYSNSYEELYPYSRAIDLWALNLVLLAVMGVDNPTEGRCVNATAAFYIKAELSKLIEQYDFVPKAVREIMCKAFSFEESDRYTFEALESAWEAISPLRKKTNRNANQARRVSTLESAIESMKVKRYGELQPLAEERMAKLTALTKSEKLTKAQMRKEKAWVKGLRLFSDKQHKATQSLTQRQSVKIK